MERKWIEFIYVTFLVSFSVLKFPCNIENVWELLCVDNSSLAVTKGADVVFYMEPTDLDTHDFCNCYMIIVQGNGSFFPSFDVVDVLYTIFLKWYPWVDNMFRCKKCH